MQRTFSKTINSCMKIPSLRGYKTYVTAGLAVLTALASYLTGDMALADAVQLAVTAIIGATLRHSISNA